MKFYVYANDCNRHVLKFVLLIEKIDFNNCPN